MEKSKLKDKIINKYFSEIAGIPNGDAMSDTDDSEKFNDLDFRKGQDKIMEETFEVKETTTTIKKYNAKELPLYFKWTKGSGTWYFRVRIREGKLISDLLKQGLEGYELTYSTVQSAFDISNEKCEEIEWRNEMHKFINQIQ